MLVLNNSVGRMNKFMLVKLAENAAIIYGLVHPETYELRYIGMSMYPLWRFKEHLYKSKGYHKDHWVKSLDQDGLRPIPILLAVCSQTYAPLCEVSWIKWAKENGARLTNITEGGDGCWIRGRVFTEEHRQRLSDSARRRIYSETECERNSDKAKKAWSDPGTRDFIISRQNEGKRASLNFLNGVKAMHDLNTGRKRTQDEKNAIASTWRTPEMRERARQYALRRWNKKEV